MRRDRYPNLLPGSIETLLTAELDSMITPVIVEAATGGRGDVAAIMADLDRAHMIDEVQTVTPLGAAYARLWRDHLARQTNQKG